MTARFIAAFSTALFTYSAAASIGRSFLGRQDPLEAEFAKYFASANFSELAKSGDTRQLAHHVRAFIKSHGATIKNGEKNVKELVKKYENGQVQDLFSELRGASWIEGLLESNVVKTDEEDNSFFHDVTPYAFPAEWYTWNHSGYPRSHQGTPTFFDLNHDGVLDYLYHNHYEADPATSWDMGLSYGTNQKGDNPFFKEIGSSHITCSEPEGSKWKEEPSMDTHGTSVIDIDRDGFLDIYMAVGGGDGHVAGPSKNAVLMWGEHGTDGVQKFAGGRDYSESANLHNKDSRGRFNYFADFNKDGLLDVVYSNEPRDDDLNVPGFMLINKGDRTFEEHRELSEYTETMVMTDADGDGHAEEFIVQRRDCGPKQCKYHMDNSCKRLASQDMDWYKFCMDRPEDTTAIYKWDQDAGKLMNIAPAKHSEVIGADEHPMSMQTGDFDGDAKADLAVLYPSGLGFFYSSQRATGALPTGEPDEWAKWDKEDCVGTALRAADLDLDGNHELLVLCFAVEPDKGPMHRLYTGGPHAWKLESREQLGDLRAASKVHPTTTQLEATCHGDTSIMPGYLRKGCEEYNGGEAKGHYASPRAMGLSVVDWDNDGFMDVSVGYDFGQMLMLKNGLGATRGKDNNFLAIKLKGTKSNEYGVGATVLLRVKNMKGDDEETVQLREVNTVSHETDWLGTHDDRLIFGLGKDGIPVSVTIRWPNKERTVQVFEDTDMLKSKMNKMKDLLVITENA